MVDPVPGGWRFSPPRHKKEQWSRGGVEPVFMAVLVVVDYVVVLVCFCLSWIDLSYCSTVSVLSIWHLGFGGPSFWIVYGVFSGDS